MTKSGIGTSVQHSLSQQSTPNTTPSIGSAEIPIWVADRKKWVTGISKKTTINDLIFAILKQCQLVPDSSHTDSSTTIEHISSQYVLTEHLYEPSAESPEAEFVLSSQRMLDGDSKVYKHLSKWSQITSNNNLMLKILQREQISDGSSEAPVQPNHNSLASKLLKKIGVNSNSNLNRSIVVHSSSVSALGKVSYVDVKLPNNKSSCANLKPAETSADTHRALLFNTIIERENRLKKQKEKFSLLDQLLHESEKKSKVVYESYNSLGATTTGSNLVELNDIYCHFPEMCTHNINEVEDFTYKCCQLFKLDEAIQSQKQILNNSELDLQRELNNQNQFGCILNVMSNESPEVVELRKEVNNSREQTRIQCKQLHDLDHKMRQSGQHFILKEQELNQLLEQLYVQEVYTDYGQEAKTPVDPAAELHEDLERINVDGDQETAANSAKLTAKLTATPASRSSTSLNQLSAGHKSLSYANLAAPVQQTSPNMQKSQAMAKLKSSPSMDMNNKNLLINTNDQLGETDSGISSMSSETAVTTNTSSSSSALSAQMMPNTASSPNSLPINNLYFNGQKSLVSNSQFGYQMGQQQYSYQQQQQQPRHYVPQHKQTVPMSNQGLTSSKQAKSVLETLV